MTKKPPQNNPNLQSIDDDSGIPDILKQSVESSKTNGGEPPKTSTRIILPPPITVGNSDDIDDLAISQDHLEEYANPGSESAVVECRRPPRGHYFTVRPESGPQATWKDRKFYWILQIEGQDPYLVAPSIAERMYQDEDTLRPLLLVRYVTMIGEEGLWPVKLNPPDGKANAWNTSAAAILELAGHHWVRIVSLKKSYRHQLSNKTFQDTPPKFTKRTFGELRDMAFNRDHIVKSFDHEVWDILANGRDK